MLLLRWGELVVTSGSRQGGSRRGSPRYCAHHGVLLLIPLDGVSKHSVGWEGFHALRTQEAGPGGRGLQTTI